MMTIAVVFQFYLLLLFLKTIVYLKVSLCIPV